jgi:hypothetical protein
LLKKYIVKAKCFIFIIQILIAVGGKAQGIFDEPQEKFPHNVLVLNLSSLPVNEINVAYERLFKKNKSIELQLGKVYVNPYMIALAKDWSNSQYFYEQGFTVKLGLKTYKPDFHPKRRSYFMPMMVYKYQFFNRQFFEYEQQYKKGELFNGTALGADTTVNYCSYQGRIRNKIGGQVLWGKIYDLGKVFSVELFYGAGATVTLANRIEEYKSPNQCSKEERYRINFQSTRIYLRPTVSAGVRLRATF